jgi:hypothetical protein
MLFIIVAVVAGSAIGLLRGGSFRNLGDVRFRRWPLLAAAVVLQAFLGFLPDDPGFAALLVSYGLTVAFALSNLRLVVAGLVALGVVMNLVPITANRGMPVRASALVAADIAEPHELHEEEFGSKRHLERPGDRFMVLADIIPVPNGHEVLSFGDLVLAVGAADVLVHVLRPPRRRPRYSATTVLERLAR